ncbi:ATPase, T2SS/T4P/T4SS family [Ralstonia sp. ASV6]|uniref:ATPase, T2SS/T4P/T4SS family n=1 Tax=Ralstonia sp. ASV6 TaxID=2795124 RepID=UPI0018EB3C11|nr:ATPase, T2SS/T4P/T4SS family [Ralstonia sp. ASV6]
MAWAHRAELVPRKTGFREPAMFNARPQLRELMLEVVAQGASETIIQTGEPILIELNGRLEQLTARRLEQAEVESLVNWASDNDKASAELIQRREIKASYVVKDPVETDIRGEKKATRFRVAAGRGEVRGTMGIQIVMRRINSEPAHLKDASLPREVVEALTPKDGIIWVTGPTGSGKTTFFSSIIRHVLEDVTPIRGNIVLLEEPIEQVYDGILCDHSIVFQIEVGRDVDTWEAGIEQLMRRLPKMIIVGETRSRATAEAVLQAANTGHPVGTTLHANDVPSIFSRLMSFFSDETKEAMLYDAINTARLMFNQVRVPKLGGGMTVLREYLMLDADLRRDLLSRTSPSKVSLHMREALEDLGVPMWRAAKQAFDAGQIDEATMKHYFKQRLQASHG